MSTNSMQLKDITNKDLAGLTNCESEPIHIPGSIQPHGFLLAVRVADKTIIFCSANVTGYLGATPEQLLTRQLTDIVPSAGKLLENNDWEHQPQQSSIISINSREFELSYYEVDELLVLEFELSATADLESKEIYEQTRQFLTFIERSKSLQQLCQNIADQTRKQTGYDRVMIYRFDKNYNGQVYAESRVVAMEPFLDLHYPHTDIPAQARDLYTRQLVRMIADVDYTPVALLTPDDGSPGNLDLGDAQLRSVSPIHIQYLKNMGVGASLTISLLKDGKLWGLIACHHRGKKQLSFRQRQAVLLQGNFLTSQIRVQEVAEEYQVNVVVEAHLQQLLNKIETDEDFAQKFEQFTSLQSVANASGVVILHKGELYEKGKVPPRDKTKQLIRWISENIRSVQFTTSSLITRYPDAAAISRYAAGVVFHALGKVTENCVIWFREEVQQTINWAGNPNTAVKLNEHNMLTPRSSFAIWKERVQHHSIEWRISEINAATRFATALQNHLHLVHLQQEEFNLRVLNDKLQKANQELSNINWITSHDMKEPLRKIQLFATRIIDKEGVDLSDILRDSIARIHKSANRMQHLVDDILSYSLTSDKDAKFEITDLRLLLEEVKENLSEEITELDATLNINVDAVGIKAIPFQIRQLFTNLFSNSLKFVEPSRKAVITVTTRQVSGAEIAGLVLGLNQSYYEISVLDNGIGFDDNYSAKLFDIFYRQHNVDAYKGTGIGLAICKKIAEHHGGGIVAVNIAGEGALFKVYLPM